MRRFLTVLSGIAFLGVAAHGVNAQGKGNHGNAVSAVAQSTCTAVNPHNSNVTNHGQCVSQAAHAKAGPTTAASTTGTATSTKHGQSGKHHGKKGAKTHGKHAAKTHNAKTHGKGQGAEVKGTEAPEPTDVPEGTETP